MAARDAKRKKLAKVEKALQRERLNCGHYSGDNPEVIHVNPVFGHCFTMYDYKHIYDTFPPGYGLKKNEL